MQESRFLLVFEARLAWRWYVETFFPLGLEAVLAPMVHLEVTDDRIDPSLKAVAVPIAALEAEHAAEGLLDEIFAELAILIHVPAVVEELLPVAIEESAHGSVVTVADAGHERLVGVWRGDGDRLQ